MEDSKKREVALFIKNICKLSLYGVCVCAIVMIVYGIVNYPPKTHYTYQGNNWPKDEDGFAVFASRDQFVIGGYISPYFSNQCKYDDGIYQVIFGDVEIPRANRREWENGYYVGYTRISDVINYINKKRVEYFWDDMIAVSWKVLVLSILSIISIYYLILLVKFVIRYGK